MIKLLQNRIILIITSLFALILVIIMTGLYPVALVDGEPIWKSSLQKSEEAEKKLTNTQAKSLGFKQVNFTSSENAELLRSLRHDILTTMIENEIIKKEGNKIVSSFEELSRKRMADTLRGNDADLAKAVRTVYSLSLNDFQNIVLLPQSRRDVLRIFLANEGKNFEEWLKEIKAQKSVKLFLVPYRWDGERVK